jgi:hypothetical protein
MSLLIAKSRIPHFIAKTLILPDVEKILNSMINLHLTDIISSNPLSNNNASRKIDEMAYNI